MAFATVKKAFYGWSFAVLASLAGNLNAEIYQLTSGDDVIGEVTYIQSIAADTFVDIARRHGLGYTDLVRANPEVDPWLPGEGTQIVLPTQFVLPDAPRRGIVLNLAEYRLYYFPDADSEPASRVVTYPISIGRMDWETPLGRTRVVAKASNPSWYVPESVHQERRDNGDEPLPRVVPPGPDNPLGSRAMRLGLPGYLIHGTNRPAGVGMRVTHGCIRMFPEDIEVFFDQIPVGTEVTIVNQPVKFGWRDGQLHMEAHEFLATAAPETAATTGQETPSTTPAVADAPAEAALTVSPETEMTRRFVAATGNRRVQPDWLAMERLLEQATGVPGAIAVTRVAPASAQSLAASQTH